jgi:ribosomal-protein-alanine N-acetyltransferase
MARREPLLHGPRVTVRLARPGDADAVAAYYRANEAHLAPFESPKPGTFFTAAWWREEAEERRREFHADRSLKTLLFDRADDRTVLGVANLTGFVRGAFHAAYVGYSLDERHQGRGLMHEGLSLLIDYAFGELNLHRIMANHMPRNDRSARVLARLGFVREGLARAYLFLNGVWEDHVLTARTNPTWRVPPGTLVRAPDGRTVEVR